MNFFVIYMEGRRELAWSGVEVVGEGVSGVGILTEERVIFW